MAPKTLHNAQKGMFFTIKKLPEDSVKIQLMRMGLSEGDHIVCSERLPGGTIVIKKKRQEIAIGAELAKQIIIS